jgi:hypothetical protein
VQKEGSAAQRRAVIDFVGVRLVIDVCSRHVKDVDDEAVMIYSILWYGM